jgi:regulator of CtrA degradation
MRIAWLLNHRAYFAGELSEFQLRRHGRLPPIQPGSDPAQLAMLDPAPAN